MSYGSHNKIYASLFQLCLSTILGHLNWSKRYKFWDQILLIERCQPQATWCIPFLFNFFPFFFTDDDFVNNNNNGDPFISIVFDTLW